jgi:multidrug efflux system membrane fusion protein
VLVVNADNQLEYRAVKLGEKVNGLRIVREGLSANEKIVVNGLQRVMPNIQIEPKLVDMATKEQLAGLRKAQQLLDKTSTSLAAESDSSADQG